MKALLKSLVVLVIIGAALNSIGQKNLENERQRYQERQAADAPKATRPPAAPVAAAVPVDPCAGQVVCQQPDGVVQAVVDYLLAEGVKYPETYKGLSWSELVVSPSSGLWMVKHRYTAKNDFGNTVTETSTFVLDIYGQVQHVF